MSAFVATGTATASSEIVSDGWWPNVDPATVRAAMRIDGAITADRLTASLINAIIAVNDGLDAWRQAREADGYTALEQVPAPKVAGVSTLVHLYVRAVGTYAAAEAAERYRSFDATDSANQRADDLTPSIDELRRDHRWAMRDLQGRSRTTVDLI